MDHDVDLVDVEAAGCHVGGDERLELPGAEALEGALPGLLAEVAVDRLDQEALGRELLHQAVGSPLGAHEDQGACRASADRGGDADAVHVVDLEEAVHHRLWGVLVLHHVVEHRVP